MKQLDNECLAAADFYFSVVRAAGADNHKAAEWGRLLKFANRLYVHAWWRKQDAVIKLVYKG